MSTVKEIESAIQSLSQGDLAKLRGWFAEFDAAGWDRQIEHDAQSGRLDAFYAHLQRENDRDPDVPLDEFLDKEKLS